MEANLSVETSLVSIIVPCYNHAEWLSCALESGLAQIYPSIEIIVVDDGSTDGSAEIMREFASRWPERVRAAIQTNQGASAARNRAFDLSHGEYIQYLDADDYLRPEKITEQVECIESTGADVVFGPWQYHRHPADGSDFLAEIDTRVIPDDLILAMLDGWWIPPVAALQRRTLVESLGGFDEAFRDGEDTIFYFQAAVNRNRFAYSPECNSVYRRQGTRATWTGDLNSAGEKIRVNRACEAALITAGRLEPVYRTALANGYFALAPEIYDRDVQEFHALLAHAHALFPVDEPAGRRRYSSWSKVVAEGASDRLATLLSVTRRLRNGNR